MHFSRQSLFIIKSSSQRNGSSIAKATDNLPKFLPNDSMAYNEMEFL